MCLSPLSQVSPSLLSPLQPGITRQMCKLVWKLFVQFNYQEPLSSSTDQNTSGEIRVEYKQSEKKKKWLVLQKEKCKQATEMSVTVSDLTANK